MENSAVKKIDKDKGGMESTSLMLSQRLLDLSVIGKKDQGPDKKIRSSSAQPVKKRRRKKRGSRRGSFKTAREMNLSNDAVHNQ